MNKEELRSTTPDHTDQDPSLEFDQKNIGAMVRLLIKIGKEEEALLERLTQAASSGDEQAIILLALEIAKRRREMKSG
jgi:hypothetical protein